MTQRLGVVTVSYNGLDHLKNFFASLEATAQTDPVDRVVVVDNASTDGTDQWLASQGIETVRLDSNQGFAAPMNLGVRHLDGCEFVALLNNDTWVEEGWSGPLREVLQAEPTAVMAGSVLTDWSGTGVDFAGGVLSYVGHAHHAPAQTLPPRTDPPRRALFVCGGAAMVKRDTFLTLGGFDEDYFAFFEDVDFGWRAWLAGWSVWLVPASRVRHRHQGTASRLPFPPRMRLYERNALATILKNYGDRALWPSLAGALFSAMARAVAYSQLDVHAFTPPASLPSAAPPEPSVAISGLSAAQLLAIEDVVASWDHWMAKRAQVQAMRRRSDHEILPLFADPGVPPLLGNPAYAALHAAVMEALDVGDYLR